MRIGIIGIGHVGAALARRWAQAGHQVFLGVRDVQKSNQRAKKLGYLSKVKVVTVHNAAQISDVIVLATPAHQADDVAKKIGDVSKKVIIDATNAVIAKPKPYQHATEALKALTGCKDVVKCFNSTGYENMLDPVYNGQAIDMFMAGDSERGKQVARALALDAGFAECYDFGGDAHIPLLEQLAMVWINLAIVQKHGRNIAFKMLKR